METSENVIDPCVEEIIEPRLADTLTNEPQAIPTQQLEEQEEERDVESTECAPEMDGEQVNNQNTMPLDPASSSFYPQSQSMYHPYYPMVFTPQQLPPNTSIIPLAGEWILTIEWSSVLIDRSNWGGGAVDGGVSGRSMADGLINNTICLFLDLYYNENYAGLAAEIFGLTETTNIQSDDSTAADEAQLPCEDVADGTPSLADRAPDPVAVDDASDAVSIIAAAAVDGLAPTTDVIVSNLNGWY